MGKGRCADLARAKASPSTHQGLKLVADSCLGGSRLRFGYRRLETAIRSRSVTGWRRIHAVASGKPSRKPRTYARCLGAPGRWLGLCQRGMLFAVEGGSGRARNTTREQNRDESTKNLMSAVERPEREIPRLFFHDLSRALDDARRPGGTPVDGRSDYA